MPRLSLDCGEEHGEPAALGKFFPIDILLDRVDLVLAGPERDRRDAVLDHPVGVEPAVGRPQDRLAADLEKLTFSTPGVPVVSNVYARPVKEAETACEALVRQVTASVRWSDSMQWLIQHGVQTFVEVGPGKVLCGIMRQIDRTKKCLNVEDEASLQKTAEFLASTQSANSCGAHECAELSSRTASAVRNLLVPAKSFCCGFKLCICCPAQAQGLFRQPAPPVPAINFIGRKVQRPV